MNWFKKSKSLMVEFASYIPSDGVFSIYINGKKYTYYNIPSEHAQKLKWMINNPKINGGVTIQYLKKFSDPQRHEELNPPKKDTPKEKDLFDELV